MPADRPRIAVFKFASCDGCQLSLLNLEDELLALAGEVEIAYFPEARSSELPPPYDVALVEGSITTAHDRERIQEVRRQAKYLVTIGACAHSGGIQALRNWKDVHEFIRQVYATPAYIESLNESTPVASHVAVDFSLTGCPVDSRQLLRALTDLLIGRTPHLPRHSVCMECKQRGSICVLVAKGVPCLGPLTQAGCGAICPAFNRGCYGCFGPMESTNADSYTAWLQAQGIPRPELVRLLRGFTGYAEEFRSAAEKLEKTLP
jgi:sulfhydrogenase subunit delta